MAMRFLVYPRVIYSTHVVCELERGAWAVAGAEVHFLLKFHVDTWTIVHRTNKSTSRHMTPFCAQNDLALFTPPPYMP